MIITLEEMKNYLRIDFDDDNALIESLIASSSQLCMDVARITDESDFEKEPTSKIAVMYAELVRGFRNACIQAWTQLQNADKDRSYE